MKYKVLVDYLQDHEGHPHEVGDTIDIEDASAAGWLVDAGLVELHLPITKSGPAVNTGSNV